MLLTFLRDHYVKAKVCAGFRWIERGERIL